MGRDSRGFKGYPGTAGPARVASICLFLVVVFHVTTETRNVVDWQDMGMTTPGKPLPCLRHADRARMYPNKVHLLFCFRVDKK